MHALANCTHPHCQASFTQAEMKNMMSCKAWNIVVVVFHTNSATTVNHSRWLAVIIAAQVLGGSQSDNFDFLGTLPLNINSFRRHLLNAYWSQGSAGERKNRKMKSSVPGFKEGLEGKIFLNGKLKSWKQELGEHSGRSNPRRLQSRWEQHPGGDTGVFLAFPGVMPPNTPCISTSRSS